MFVFRSTIQAALAILAIALASSAQDIQTLGPTGSAGTFKLVPGATFSASAGRSERRPKLATPLKRISDDFDEALELIRANHATSRDEGPTRRFSSAINGMLRELDPHSAYYTAKEFKALNDDHRGRYFGIGTTISNFRKDGRSGVYVLSVKKDSPAAQAGLRFGDQIVNVDGTDVREMDSVAVRDLVRGPEGTLVTLRVERWGAIEPTTFRVRRANVAEPSIPAAFIVSDGVGFIALTEGFSYTTTTEFEAAFRKLRKQGMRSLIVDLRGNGGGLMEQAVSIAEKFLPAGRVIVSQHSRQPLDERVAVSQNKRPETLPLVLLVDGNTASASEIFAAAMQDNDRATIVGTRTFGKGLVQDIIPLEDGSGLVLTSERYYTPSGRSIQRDYSDSGLYDYFRHISKGTLVDKSTFAARTLKGRIVHGGDGIAPDVHTAAITWTSKDLRDYENAFFLSREGTADSVVPKGNLERHNRFFRALSTGANDAALEISLINDPQIKAAVAVAASSLN